MTACARTEPAQAPDPFAYEPRPLPLDVLIAAHERLVARMRQIEQNLVQMVAEVHVTQLQMEVARASLQAHQEANRGS